MIVTKGKTVDRLRMHLEVANLALTFGGWKETTQEDVEALVKRISHYERAIKRLR